jgi:hypothetical protein
MDDLADRVFVYPEDPNRIYNEAVSQRDRIGPRTQTHDMSKQMGRDFRPPVNRNVERMRELDREHRCFLDQWKEKPSARRPAKEPKRPLSAFDDQHPRAKNVFPDQKTEEHKERFWPFDPIASRETTESRADEPSIGLRPKKPLRGKHFWTFTGGHTRPRRR